MDLAKKWDLFEDSRYDPSAHWGSYKYIRLNENQREGANYLKVCRFGRDQWSTNLFGNTNEDGSLRYRKVGRLMPYHADKTMPPRMGDVILIHGGNLGIVQRITNEGILVKRQSSYSNNRDQIVGRASIKRIARLATNSAVMFEL